MTYMLKDIYFDLDAPRNMQSCEDVLSCTLNNKINLKDGLDRMRRNAFSKIDQDCFNALGFFYSNPGENASEYKQLVYIRCCAKCGGCGILGRSLQFIVPKDLSLSTVCAVCRTDVTTLQCTSKVYWDFDLDMCREECLQSFLEVYRESTVVVRRTDLPIEDVV